MAFRKGHYYADEETFKNDAYEALKFQFSDREGFEIFYSSLSGPEVKDEFLRVATFYLFFVKSGDWHVAVERSNPVIDYITNSFKLISAFSLIESLSDKEYKDFYEWLKSQPVGDIYPIKDRNVLEKLYEKYKEEYGSIRRCKAFFENLPPANQRALCNAIKLEGTPLDSVKKVAEFLYEARSGFVHNADIVLMVGGGSNFSRKGKKLVQANLELNVLLESVENGILTYFKKM
ncbi:MAG TPA: hypothetical protein VJ746_13625 [Nitrospira sp.]|nr:hypothetical protein [Nitrospira sp.]